MRMFKLLYILQENLIFYKKYNGLLTIISIKPELKIRKFWTKTQGNFKPSKLIPGIDLCKN
jgi:hypothetical protein